MTPAPFFMWQSAHRPFPVPTNLVFMSCNDFEKSRIIVKFYRLFG